MYGHGLSVQENEGLLPTQVSDIRALSKKPVIQTTTARTVI